MQSIATTPPVNDEPPIQKFIQELDAVETVPRHPTTPNVENSGPVRGENATFSELQAAVRSLQVETEVSVKLHGEISGYIVYAAVRERILALCNDLVRQSHLDNTLDELSGATSPRGLDSLWHRQSVADSWYITIRRFRAYLEELLSGMHQTLTATYRSYRPDATPQQLELLFRDRSFRDAEIRWMRNPGISIQFHQTSPFWFEYVEGFRNYQRVQHDLDQVDVLLSTARTGNDDEVQVRKEYDIAPKGDTILEFPNTISTAQPLLIFRVSSSILEAASPYFAQVLSSTIPEGDSLRQLPPAPTKRLHKDGSEVTVYRMPQTEFNKWDSLTILLRAAHHQYDKVPRQIKFHEFVSIAEVCLRYQCTAPLEMSVEHRWLPQWIHRALDDPDEFLLISYCFGIRQIFKRCCKTAILNITCYEELHGKQLWPCEVKDKIDALREAKLAQIYDACIGALEEYFRPPKTMIGSKSGPREASSSPRCPRGSQECDATNLGWLMMLFNELGIMPQIMTIGRGIRSIPSPPRRSIQEIMDIMKRVRWTPQVKHSNICDHAASLNSTMNNIYNGISGLTLWDIAGKGGWALSKHHDHGTGLTNGAGTEVFELPVTALSTAANQPLFRDETVTLRLLTHLDTIEDLQAAAQVNTAFYAVYKKHELFLMRSLMRAKRKISSPGLDGLSAYLSQHVVKARPAETARSTRSPELRLTGMSKSFETSDDENFAPSTPHSPAISIDEATEDSCDSWWPGRTRRSDVQDEHSSPFQLDPDFNSKFLPADRDHTDNMKSLVTEGVSGKKHLRAENDRNLRPGFTTGEPVSSS